MIKLVYGNSIIPLKGLTRSPILHFTLKFKNITILNSTLRVDYTRWSDLYVDEYKVGSQACIMGIIGGVSGSSALVDKVNNTGLTPFS